MAGKKSAPHFFNFLLSSPAMLTLCNVVLVLMLPATAPAAEAGTIPSHSLAGGGTIPLLAMGGNDFQGWFKAAGKGAMIQTFHGYGNAAHLAPQLKAAGRGNVFVSTGIPCGCCGTDAPAIQPMNETLAMQYIDDELKQLNTSYVDLLLFHHRCKTDVENAAVWTAFEAAKQAGKAKHIGVSNFNTYDLTTLAQTAKEPVEVLEAHFGVGLMDWEVMKYANAQNIHPVSFSSLSQSSTDLPNLASTVSKVASAHNITSSAAMYAYVVSKNITVLSSYDPAHPEWLAEDMAIFNVKLSDDEIFALDALTLGKRTCPDCYTDECQVCAQTLSKLGCPIGDLHGGFVWGRSNPKGMECIACAALPQNKDAVMKQCGNTGKGETLETLVPKACQIG